MGIFDSLGSIFGNSDGTGAGANILGGLTTGAMIYNAFQGNKDKNVANDASLAESKRQFDLNYALQQQKLAQDAGGGGGGGSGAAMAQIAAQLKMKQADLLHGAYGNQAKLALEGRTGEANQLNNLLAGINQVLLNRPMGAQR